MSHSSGRSGTTESAAWSFLGRPAKPLGLGPALLGRQPALDRRPRRLGRPPRRRRRRGRFGQQLAEPGGGGLPVPQLRSVFGGDHGNQAIRKPPGQSPERPLFQRCRQSCRTRKVVTELHSGVSGIHRLPARARRPGKPPAKLVGRNRCPSYRDLKAHRSHIARRAAPRLGQVGRLAQFVQRPCWRWP
jgi:hypothetical protein